MEPMFSFDPRAYAASYAAEGYVHIPRGLTNGFLALLSRQVEEYLRAGLVKNFVIGDKQQAIYQFPAGQDYHGQLLDAVAAVCGLNPRQLVLSERHIKAYDADAAPHPLAHKDRFASQVSVGLSVRVPPGSTLVLYPYDELDINPFNSSTEYRASLSPDRVPETTLQEARRVEIHDTPGDVIIFRGHAIWHLRERPANTVMLYLKLNTFYCDPLDEDARTPELRRHTEALLRAADAELAEAVPILGRRVDYIHRRFTRDWHEVVGVVLYGEKHFTIDQIELQALRMMDGRQSVRSLLKGLGERCGQAPGCGLIRRLAARGVIDLLPVPNVGSCDAATLSLKAEADAPSLAS
jgi:hypothetical protein